MKMLNDDIKNFHDECGKVDEFEDKIKKIRNREEKSQKIREKKDSLKRVSSLMNQIKISFLRQIESGNFLNVSDNEIVEFARALGRFLSYSIKMNTIRRFLTAFREIEKTKSYSELVLIRPKLAYAVGRSGSEERLYMQVLMDFFDPILQKTSATADNDEQAKKFEKNLKFMEAIIAYYRYYGGGNE